MNPEDHVTTMNAGLAFGEPIPERIVPTLPFLDEHRCPWTPVHAAAHVLLVEDSYTTPMIEAQRMIRAGGEPKVRAVKWLRDELLWRLRGNDPERVGRIARGGGPLMTGDRFHLFCPICGCRKSGDLETPNTPDDRCDNPDCPCHEGED